MPRNEIGADDLKFGRKREVVVEALQLGIFGVGVVGIDHSGESIHLNLGFREFNLYEFASALGELRGATKNFLAV